MINGVSSSQNDYTFVTTREKNSENATNEEPERSDEEKFGYKLDLSDGNWKSLGKKEELSEEDQRKVEELKKIDRRVHTHEQAHLSAAGGYARGGASYDYVMGPDGNKYANAGHVNIDTSREKTPEATIRKANIVQKAALAPADPSPADKQIAASAAKMAEDAQKELAEERKGEEQNTPNTPQAMVSESTG